MFLIFIEGVFMIITIKNFKEILKKHSTIPGKDKCRDWTKGIFFEKEDNFVICTSTDGRRLASTRHPIIRDDEKDTEDKVIVSLSFLKRVLAEIKSKHYLDEVNIYLNLTEKVNYVIFPCGTEYLESFLIEESKKECVESYCTFPDYREVIPDNFENVIAFSKDSFFDILKTAKKLIPKEKYTGRIVNLKLSNETFEISYQYIENAIAIKKTCSVSVEKNAVEKSLFVSFNIVYLLDYVNSLSKEVKTIKCAFNDHESPFSFYAKDDPYTFIIMPILQRRR